MRFLVILMLGTFSTLTAQEVVENFRLSTDYSPYVDPDGMILRSVEMNETPERWPESKQSAYAKYPLAMAMESSAIPMMASEACALLRNSAKPIAIGFRWVKHPISPELPPCLRRIVIWREPRLKYLNEDELSLAAKRGDFDNLAPPFPIGRLNSFADLPRVRASYVDFPIVTATTRLSPDGQRLDPMPVEFAVKLYSALSVKSDYLIDKQLDAELVEIGSGRDGYNEVLHMKGGVVLKGPGTQFGHTGYRWVSGGNLFTLRVMGKDRAVLEAFLQHKPSELPADFSLDRKTAGLQMLRRGLERLRKAPPVIEDDKRMIRLRPMQNQDLFGRGLDLLLSLKDLWPLTYGHQQAREERYWRLISDKSQSFDWQAYIDEETAARAKTLAAVEAFAIEVEKRGLIYQAKVPRDPWQLWAADALPPCWVLGPEK